MSVELESPQLIDPSLTQTLERLQRSSELIGEAQFGYRHIADTLKGLPPSAEVLEVGAGAGILLAHIAKHHPALQLTGIEPIGPGFDTTKQLQEEVLRHTHVTMRHTDYESFHTETQYDLIYLINVFEHLPNWRHFLSFVKAHLKPNGQCLILCPNYGFPYESHFSIPILFNKTLTHRLFGKAICDFEKKNNAHGLWSSLNFVKYSEVKRHARQLGLTVRFDTHMTRSMIERLTEDTEFAGRQKTLHDLPGWHST